ncbi:MarR family winged helix-turn-helix transcriptional regulator [Priestia megaterium]|uniref:MarR family winged helix-turn-helix transcriptional regulator n=1 Tax=Priestia megaterium TaxID=1404 RepID=UPI000BECE748|nr:MarR family winged helix-turn-helix transcriptional regulator [Priestia megaterium]MBM6601925.1 winged helix-turn-helix transcriptional regulator [Priestia megaterium]MED4030338.1 MarR family winged helix-turn-helix transcriptional regulator [Priestia megaterium]PEE73339.1 MarR family transcriptional regulator [Priestia megaterium]PEU53176.1 MarR family transcriptional regulator [Priestia megaterium]
MIYVIEDEIRELLDKISAQMRRNYNHLLQDVNLHVGQDNLLCKLWKDDGLTQLQLCEHLKCEPPTVTNMVKALEQKGIVYRQRDEKDGRVSRVYLTHEGRDLEGPVNERWRKQQDKLLAGIVPEERLLLRRLMKKMAENLF